MMERGWCRADRATRTATLVGVLIAHCAVPALTQSPTQSPATAAPVNPRPQPNSGGTQQDCDALAWTYPVSTRSVRAFFC